MNKFTAHIHKAANGFLLTTYKEVEIEASEIKLPHPAMRQGLPEYGAVSALEIKPEVIVTAETLLAVVVLTEELSARDRGWGIGLLGALGSLGHGVAAAALNYFNRSLDELSIAEVAFLAAGQPVVRPCLRVDFCRRELTRGRRSGHEPTAIRRRR